MSKKNIRIGILGAESTGKSTLAKELAEHYSANFVTEYAREYVERKPKYDYQDVIKIGQKVSEQIRQEYESRIVLFDTELINIKVWFEHKWGECPNFIKDALTAYPLDYYLITHCDLPFVEDSVRENKDIRAELESTYISEIKKLGIEYFIIDGTGEERVKKAIKAIDRYIANYEK